MKPLYPRTICADGTTLSIQASEFHYCSPRDNSRDPWWNYNLVELGYPENADGTALILPDTFATYADGNYPSNVYGYVPIDLVLTFIEQHGGIADS